MKKYKTRSLITLLLFPLCLALAIERVSINSSGEEATDGSNSPSISNDGRWVAFTSVADNLVENDSNNEEDVFVHDRQTGQTKRISTNSSGTQANHGSSTSMISADGRFVTFASNANNLVINDNNDMEDIFVHHLVTGQTVLISVDSAGTQGNNDSHYSTISADGRFVAFASLASNLVAGDTNNVGDVFVHDLISQKTERVSVNDAGVQGNAVSSSPFISADGRFVAFVSEANNLVANDNNDNDDIFVHDRQTGVTQRVSIGSGGTEGNGLSSVPSITEEGRFVAFLSEANNLVANDNNDNDDIFVHDRQTGATQRVSVSSTGAESNDYSEEAFISADGRFVVFESGASNLVADDNNGTKDIFVHDRQTGQVKRVNVDSMGNEANSFSNHPFISGDGRFVLFTSWSNNLVANDNNGTMDVFVYGRFIMATAADAVPMINLAFLIGLIGLVSGAALLVCGRARRGLPSGSCPLP